jgi:hypothetical protein
MLPRHTATYLIYITSIGWLANLVVGLVSGNSDPAVHGVFTFVIGALYMYNKKTKPGDTGSKKDPGGGPDDPA